MVEKKWEEREEEAYRDSDTKFITCERKMRRSEEERWGERG